MIKLIATDLDATFLRADKTFNEDLLRTVLTKLKTFDGYFVVATGNHVQRVATYFANFSGQYQLIANNGAEVVLDGSIQNVKSLPEHSLSVILSLVEQLKTAPQMGLVYTAADRSFMLASQAPEDPAIVKNANDFFENLIVVDHIEQIDVPVLKATVVVQPEETPEFMQAVRLMLPHQVHVTTSGYGAIDIVNIDVNKANALQYLANKLSIEPDEIMAFGDGLNDMEMLDFAGHPYAMPNSDPALFDHDFNVAVSDNEHDGVLNTILEVLNTQKE